MINRIAKLLNQAEHAATEAEAVAFFEKAQALATAHSISLARARLHTSDRRGPNEPINRTIQVGPPRRHANRHLVLLMVGIAAANDVTVDVARDSSFVVLYGFPDDLATCEAMWTRVATQMVRFADRYLATDAWREDWRVVRDSGRERLRPMTKQTARATYYQAFIAELATRIAAARRQAVLDAERDEAADPVPAPAGSTSTALALQAKQDAVARLHREQSRPRGRWNGRGTVIGVSESARDSGRRDARQVPLGDQPELPGAPRQVPR